MHGLEKFNARELPKSVRCNVFHARVVHEQNGTSGAFLNLPCPFDTCCGNPRHASGRNDWNAILVSRQEDRTQGVGNSRIRINVHLDAFHVFRPSREFRLIRTVFGMMLVRFRVDTCIDEIVLEFIRVDVAFDGQVPRGLVNPSVRPNLLEIDMQRTGI
jgi:hypothetical protein